MDERTNLKERLIDRNELNVESKKYRVDDELLLKVKHGGKKALVVSVSKN